MAKYEDGKDDTYKYSEGYGEGENDGTRAVRSGMLWRDYMRQWMQKIGPSIFCLEGYNKHKRGHNDPGKQKPQWKTTSEDKASPDQDPKPQEVARILERLYAGTTGMGLIDASQRELIHTGYTSNRARQNVASFLAKHLGIDWRYGAEWYEMLLVDYDVSSNWANWQYFAGVGNGRRDRIFNPVKQAFDYDKEGTYVKTWVPELRGLRKPENIFQAWTASTEDLEKAGLAGNVMVTDPIKGIEFFVEGKPRSSKGPCRYKRGTSRRAQQLYKSTEGPSQPTTGPASPIRQPVGPPRGPRFASPGRRGYLRGAGRYRGGRGGHPVSAPGGHVLRHDFSEACDWNSTTQRSQGPEK